MVNTTANFLLSDLKSVQPIDGWQDFMHDGKGFLKTAIGAHAKRKHIFTSEILYNIIAMAIEKFVMAALMRYGAMPYNGARLTASQIARPAKSMSYGEQHFGVLHVTL